MAVVTGVVIVGLLPVPASAADYSRTVRVSVSSTGAQANDETFDPAVSADGRYVAFTSAASNLVPGDTNSTGDVFVRDTLTGRTRRVSVSSTGAQSALGGWHPAISADGRHVAFGSHASNLVPGDTNNATDVFVHDMTTGKTRRVDVSSTGAQSDSSSADPAISADGRSVAFYSSATDLVPGDTNNAADVFVHDMTNGKTRRVSVSSTGAQVDVTSFTFGAGISANGRYIVFNSTASSLVPADTNDSYDVFVHDVATGQTRRVSVTSDGSQGDGPSLYQAISADGRHVAFQSFASNLVPGDTNAVPDVFLHHLVGS